MRVGVNLIGLRPGIVGGLETYVHGLLGEMAHMDGLQVFAFASSDTLRTLSQVPGLERVSLFDGPYGVRRRLGAETLTLWRALRQHPVDVLFSPASYAPLRVPASIKQVATIHDIQHLTFPQNFSRKTRLGRAALHWHTLRRCSRLIASSEFTRQDLLSRYSLAPERIVTVHLGVPRRSRPADGEIAEARGRYRLPKRFLYYPAMMAPHKNHPFLLEVVGRLSRRDPDAPHLVLSGKMTPEWQTLQAISRRLRIQDRVVHLGFVPYEDVWRVLSAAEAMVYPSEFEGFGLPVLEGQQCGVPVVASDIPPLREILQQSAVILPLGDPEAWVSALTVLHQDAARRERLIDLGLANAQRFSWPRCAEETVSVLRGCASGTPPGAA